jgi:hypothetical protein
MKRLILATVILLLLPALLSAHPGRTASDGCHYCRTNCDKWGVPWGKRHCHNRELEPLPISKIKTESNNKEKAAGDFKVPGWEYGLKIEKVKKNKNYQVGR